MPVRFGPVGGRGQAHAHALPERLGRAEEPGGARRLAQGRVRAGELAQGEDEVPAVADGPPQDEALPKQVGRAGVVALRPGHVRQTVQGVGHAPGVPQPPAQRQGLGVVAPGASARLPCAKATFPRPTRAKATV